MSTEKKQDEEILEKNTPGEQTAEEPAAEAGVSGETSAGDTQEGQTEATSENNELAGLQSELTDLSDRFMRMAAEYDNFRKRSIKERDAVHNDAVSYAVTKLLPVYDNLERALAQETEDTEYKKGVELIYKQFIDSLDALKVKEVPAAPGDPFDPTRHNAVMHVEDESLGENQIAEVFQKGFQIGEKVIRHTIVKVAN